MSNSRSTTYVAHIMIPERDVYIKYSPTREDARKALTDYVTTMQKHGIETSLWRPIISKEGCKDELVTCD